MKPEKLEYLFDSFITSRLETDSVDGLIRPQVVAQCADGYDDPLSGFNLNGGQFPSHLAYGNAAAVGIPPPLHTVSQSPHISSVGRELKAIAAEFSMSRPDNSCVKFEKSCIIVAPEEQTISVTVVRSDTSVDKVIKVTWKTQDKTALSGIHYIGSSGEFMFDEGVTSKTIQIPILKMSEDVMDLRFIVELSVVDEGFDPKPMTISLKKLDDFYADERQVIENLPFSPPFTVSDIKCVLEDSLTIRTFHMALTHLCSAADSVHLEFALAFDLSQLCLRQLRRDCVLKVLGDFFRMEDIEC